jgi:hypothetical protein
MRGIKGSVSTLCVVSNFVFSARLTDTEAAPQAANILRDEIWRIVL